MSIMTVEVRGARGFGNISAGLIRDAVARARQNAGSQTVIDNTVAHEQAHSVFGPEPSGDFLSTWGVPIVAGAAGIAVGLVVVKLARRRKG